MNSGGLIEARRNPSTVTKLTGIYEFPPVNSGGLIEAYDDQRLIPDKD